MRSILTAKDFHKRPWKNGRGSTLELLKNPADSGDDFLFRLSQADLNESGPFSHFPGIDRILVVTEGKEIKLNDVKLPLWQAFSFRGEEDIHAEITSPGKDFNLMLRRGKMKGSVTIAKGSCQLKADADFFAALTFSPLSLYVVEKERGTFLNIDSPENFLIIRIDYV
ncbi:MAG: HutD family protein [Bacteriovoracaceae bacterium]